MSWIGALNDMAGTLKANKGGTGLSAFTIGDLLCADSTSTLSKISAGSAATVLTSNGPGAQPTYQTIASIGGVTGTGTTGLLPKWTNGAGGVIGNSTWGINGNDIYPVTDGANIGISGTNRIGTIYMSSVIDYSTTFLLKSAGVQKLSIDTNGFMLFNNNQGLDVITTGGTDVLNIGTSNADTINIGWSGANINIIGNTFYENVTNLQVKDKLFTVNKGGAAGSGASAGFEIEENSIITGYFATSGTRDGWDFKAPAITGALTLSLASLSTSRILTAPDVAGTIATINGGQTFTSATWNAGLISATYGGTGVNNGTKTLTFLKNISFTAADDTGVYTLPTGTKTLVATDVTTLSSLISVGTITTGGLGTGATLGSVTVNITSSAVGDIWYAGTSNVMTRLASVVAGSYLRSGGVTTAPTWSTLTLPNTITSDQLLYATGTNAVGSGTSLIFAAHPAVGTALQVINSDSTGGNTGFYAKNTSATGQTSFYFENDRGSFASYGGLLYGGSTEASSLFGVTRADKLFLFADGASNLGFYIGTLTSQILGFGVNNTGVANFGTAGRFFIGSSVTAATAYLHIKAGTATASTAPLKFTAGTNLSTAEAGAFEYNGTNLFFTRSGTTREGILTQSAVTTETVVSDTTVTVNINGTTYKLLARA